MWSGFNRSQHFVGDAAILVLAKCAVHFDTFGMILWIRMWHKRSEEFVLQRVAVWDVRVSWGQVLHGLFRHHVHAVQVRVAFSNKLGIHCCAVEHIHGHLVLEFVGTTFEVQHHLCLIKHKAFKVSGSGKVSH